MITLLLRSAGGALLLLAFLAGSARATDDYTLPFHDPNVTLSYGVDRDSRLCVQADWTGQVWLDCAAHWGRVYDNHTGMDFPMSAFSAVAAARDGVVLDLVEGFGTWQFGASGNYVLLGHPDGKRTLYYHLAQNGVLVNIGDQVNAGQVIAQSGCSGKCYGEHLHFELLAQQNGWWFPADPNWERRWTTWPGRVPFLASYWRENNSGAETIIRGQTIAHWVEFRNDGGRTWRNDLGLGRILLGTWNPAAHASAFRAWDWGSSWFATNVDRTAAPGQIGRFTFGLYGGPAPGSYRETFNLCANSLYWFDHARLGGLWVPINVVWGTSPTPRSDDR